MSRAPTSSEHAPVRFGDYLLVERLGAGGMGEVFLAQATGLGDIEKLLVVKTLRPEHTRDAEYVGRFIDEARVVVQLSHRNICQVFDVGRVGETFYLAMEHIDGRDLKTLLARVAEHGGVLPADIAVFVAGEVLEALDYAHRLRHPVTGQPLQIVHRDVSPQNVMVNFEGEAKLIDFGLAASRLKVERTRPDIVMGKMAYMAPEQARGEPLTPGVDVFALGVTLYEMLTGERYYQGLSAPEVLDLVGGRAASEAEYRPKRFSSLDPGMRRVLDRALRRDPAERYQDCATFQEDLEAWLLERKLRAGTRQLRALLEEHFGADRARDRERLAAIRAAATRAAATSTRREAHADETVRIAVDPALSEALGLDAAAPPDHESDVFAKAAPALLRPAPQKGGAAVEDTQRIERPAASAPTPGPRRSRVVLTVAGAAGAVIAFVILAVAGSSSSGTGPGSSGSENDRTVDPGSDRSGEDDVVTGGRASTPDAGVGAAAVEPGVEHGVEQGVEHGVEHGVEQGVEQEGEDGTGPRIPAKARKPPKRPRRVGTSVKDPGRREPGENVTSEASSPRPPAPSPVDDRAPIARRTSALKGCGCDDLARRAGFVRTMDESQLRSHVEKVAACERACSRTP